MVGTKVGHVTREAGTLVYVDGNGGVISMPARGHKGSKKKIGQVQRIPGALCWCAGNGDVLCKKR